MFLLLCCAVVFTGAMLAGCQGDDGAAGAPGAPGPHGSYASSDCIDCHHLNDLQINEFTETFVAGLGGPDKVVSQVSATTRTTTLSFDATKLPAGEVAQSFLWTRTNGLVATTSTAVSSASLTVTVPASPNYKNELVRHVKGLLITELDGTVVADRTRIVPVNPLNFEEAFSVTYKLRVATTSGKFYYALVRVLDSTGEGLVEEFAAVGTGINTVPNNVPVLIRSATSTTGYNWTLTRPAGSAAVMVDPTTQLPHFVPDVTGRYVATETVSGVSIDVYAGTWQGVITGQNASGRPVSDTACTVCHNDTIAPDKFTPWSNSGHAEILTQNINDPAGHWTVAGCAPCHTVGFDLLATNGGFDEFASLTTTGTATIWAFSGHGGPNEWTNLLTSYPNTARLANIQCENCHGPQVMPGANGSATNSHTTSTRAAGPRTSMSADMCGACHGEPQRHSRFQQWEDSGHGNHELAVAEGVSSGNVNGNCGGCHSGQGFIRWLKELQAGDPLRTVTSFSLSTTDVVPQTCQVCHDPHILGNTSGEPNTANLRVQDNTPKLPGGFAATGVGRGAICFVCHNSRNGGSGTDAFLHQDGDPVFGFLTSYSGPHEANQGDMLLGYNAYFVGSGNYRSPHSLIVDTCANCHMEQTPPPALLSYNLAGTNHTFKASLNICDNCHGINTGLGPMLQAKIRSTLEQLETAIGDKIVSRNTVTDFRANGSGCIIKGVADLGSRGSVNVTLGSVIETAPTCTALPTETFSASLSTMRGIRICTATVTTDCLETDNLAKALWNFYLVEQDQSFGIHNPDFTLEVLGQSQFAVDSIPTDFIPSNEQ